MACCGQRKPVRPNGKICCKCGWVMYRVHKYDNNKKTVDKYWQCANKVQGCLHKEDI